MNLLVRINRRRS